MINNDLIKNLLTCFKKPEEKIIQALQHQISQALKIKDISIETKVKNHLPEYLKKISLRNNNNEAKIAFISMYLKYITGETGKIPWSKIGPLKDTDSIEIDKLTENHTLTGINSLEKVCIIKLNGGLGTTMGCSGPKSAIPVYNDLTFLDIVTIQLKELRKKYKTEIPMVLMNSNNTKLETARILKNKIDYLELIQNEFPKINKKTGLPLSYPEDKSKEWNPPGHGDIYLSLYTSGLLESLLEKGYTHAFISNSDNLGATLNTKIFGYMIENKIDFLMETAVKTRQDVKGGTIIRINEHLELLERAQVENEHIKEFEDIKLFKVFNTNNIWINLKTLKQYFEKGYLDLPLIINNKTVGTHEVIQLEQAMGAAVSVFPKSSSIIVDRNRFLPVKKTSDLLILQSDYIEKDHSGNFQFNPEALSCVYPEIKLSNHFDKIDKYTKRFTYIPSLKKVKDLTIKGDITFGNNMKFEGSVKIESSSKKTCLLENEYLSNIAIHIDSSGIKKNYNL